MQYKSPLHLLDPTDIEDLDAGKIRQKKKILLLRFELEERNQIIVNGHRYDRDSLIKVLDDLSNKLEAHLWLYKHKRLLGFIEAGDLTFFDRPEDWNLLTDSDFGDWVCPLFIARFSETIYNAVQARPTAALVELVKIYYFNFEVPAQYIDQTYLKASRTLKLSMASCRRQMQEPFKKTSKNLQLKEEIVQFFNYQHLKLLKQLPDHFLDIKMDLLALSHDFINRVIEKEGRLGVLPMPILQSLNIATLTAYRLGHNVYHKSLNEAVGKEIDAREGMSPSEAFIVCGVLALLIYALIVLLIPGKEDPWPRGKTLENKDIIGFWADQELDEVDWQPAVRVFEFKETSGEEIIYLPQKKTLSFCEYKRFFAWKINPLDDQSNSYQLTISYTDPPMSSNCEDRFVIGRRDKNYPELMTLLRDTVKNTRLKGIKPWYNSDDLILKIGKGSFTQLEGELFSIFQKNEINRHQAWPKVTLAKKAQDEFLTGRRFRGASGGRLPHKVSPTDLSFYLYCDRQAYKIANGTFVQGKYFIQPNCWVTDTTDLVQYTLPQFIRYFDQNGNQEFDRLLVYYDPIEDSFCFKKAPHYK